MKFTLALVAVAALTLSGVGVANAQKLDANGRCHGANGEFAQASVCSGASTTTKTNTTSKKKSAAGASKTTTSTATTAAVTPTATGGTTTKTTSSSTTKTVAKAKCKDAKGKFVKCSAAGATPAAP